MVKKTKKKSEKIDLEKERRKDKNTILAIAAIAGAVAVLVVISYGLQSQSGSDQASRVDGIRCEKAGSYSVRTAIHLDMFVNGRPYKVPAQIGSINDTCRYWIYTVDTSGTIHLDSPDNREFSLSQFFDIWKATSSPPPDGIPLIFIDGKKSDANLNGTTMEPHDEIVIAYGAKPAIIPKTYQFPPSL